MMTFEQFVRPALRKMMGFIALVPAAGRGAPRRGSAQEGRAPALRARQARAPRGEIFARSTGNQSSGVLRSMMLAQGALIFPAEATELRAGDTASVQVLDEDFFAAATPGF